MKNSRGATIYRLNITENASVTDKQIISAVTGKSIYIHQIYLDTADNTSTITLKSNGTTIAPPFFFASKGDKVIIPGYGEIGWFKANTNLTVSSTHGFSGFIVYTQE